MTKTVSIFADLGQRPGGSDVGSSVSDIIGDYILKQVVVNDTLDCLSMVCMESCAANS